jgi:hypothetical protein
MTIGSSSLALLPPCILHDTSTDLYSKPSISTSFTFIHSMLSLYPFIVHIKAVFISCIVTFDTLQ